MDHNEYGEVMYDEMSDACFSARTGQLLVRRTKTGWRIERAAFAKIGVHLIGRRTRIHDAIARAKKEGLDKVMMATLVWRAIILAKIDEMGPERYRYEVARALRRAGYSTKVSMLEGDCEPQFTWRDAFSQEWPWVWGNHKNKDLEQLEFRARAVFLALAEHQGYNPPRTNQDPW